MPVKHIALIKFKSGTTAERIKAIFAEIKGLTKSIAGITDYAQGVNSSTEGFSQGLTHGFIMTFRNQAALDAYLPHPEHERVKAFVLPFVESVVIFDFEV